MSNATNPSHESAYLKTFLPPVQVRGAGSHECPERESMAVNIKSLRYMEGKPVLELNEHDGRKRGLDGSHVNQPTSQQLTDLGRGPVFYDRLVEVQAVV